MHSSGGLFGGIIDGFKDIAHIAEFAFVDIVANNLRANFDIETTIQLQKVFTIHLLGGPQSLTGFSVSHPVVYDLPTFTNMTQRSPVFFP